MNERPPVYSPTEDLRTRPPYRTAPPSERPRTPRPYAPPPAEPFSWLRPFAFLGGLVAAVVIALGLLFLSDDAPPDQLSPEELSALLADPPEPSELPPLWDTPTRTSDLQVHTVPAGASVRLNDEWVGFSPLHLDETPPGYYTLRFEAPDHVAKDTSFYLASGSILQLDVWLDPVDALTEPFGPTASGPSSDVWSTAPAPRRLEQRGQPAGGGASLPQTAPTSAATEQSESTEQFEVASPEEVHRASHTGSLSVTSNPPGAIVLVDGVPFGRAPLSLSDLRPGSYIVTVTLPGQDPLSYQAEVAAQSVAVVKAAFPPPSSARGSRTP